MKKINTMCPCPTSRKTFKSHSPTETKQNITTTKYSRTWMKTAKQHVGAKVAKDPLDFKAESSETNDGIKRDQNQTDHWKNSSWN